MGSGDDWCADKSELTPDTFILYTCPQAFRAMDPSHAQSGGHLDDVPAAVTVPSSQEVRNFMWLMCIGGITGADKPEN